ncbi:alcohol dehydrogenase catalytic domain-containing protein [Nocardioides sp.]|uniref:alcohol dehydrogenase catalytic domain-containing protein n=1 Tax=Nocardioides sp. TaxID=35761 RepID=UPI0026180108|nr:alcohol dehydrogenase catalytic domain-containing protein [Nocardioides sp.]
MPEPTLQDAQDAIVGVEHTGICGTDVHAMQGHLPGVPAGTVLGHEFVGTVLATGGAVTSINVGDRVVGTDFTACGNCWHCRRHEHWHCPRRRFLGTGTSFGPELSGAQAEQVRVPFADICLAVLPRGLDSATAVLLCDNFPTGFAAAKKACVAPGDVVAVVGGGMVGQLAALAAQHHGASVVVVSDPVEARQSAARSTGNLATVPERLVPTLHELTAGRGADVVVEAVGGATGLDAALLACRPGGTVASVSAHVQKTWSFPLADAFAREITVQMVIGDPLRDRDSMLALATSGLLGPAHDLMRTADLTSAVDAYSDAAHSRYLKIVLTV